MLPRNTDTNGTGRAAYQEQTVLRKFSALKMLIHLIATNCK